MTYQSDCTLPIDLLDHLTEGGLEALPDAMRLLLNAAMLLERQKFIGADPYQRTSDRQAHANGFKDKTLQTRMGSLTVAVPQVREGGFYPQSLEKGVRSERALKLALAEMYVQGVSTRKVAAITEQMCGFEVSSTQVSRAAAELDTVFEAWRTRPLGEYPYLYVDARYEKVRLDGQVRDAAVLGCQRGRCDWQTRDPGSVSGALRTGAALADILPELGGARAARCAVAHLGCACWVEGGAAGGVWRRAVAALPVSSAAERASVCSACGDEEGGGGSNPGGV